MLYFWTHKRKIKAAEAEIPWLLLCNVDQTPKNSGSYISTGVKMSTQCCNAGSLLYFKSWAKASMTLIISLENSLHIHTRHYIDVSTDWAVHFLTKGQKCNNWWHAFKNLFMHTQKLTRLLSSGQITFIFPEKFAGHLSHNLFINSFLIYNSRVDQLL